MARIPLVSPENLSKSQQQVYDKIVSGPRGALVGPLRAALHSPELADRWQALGEFLRYRTSLPGRLSELAIIAVGRYWNSDVEWFIHAKAALSAGLSEEIIESIRCANQPVFADDDEATVYEFARQLLKTGNLHDEAYRAAHAILGTIGVVELTALVGYYSMVCMTLNAHHVPIPAGESSPVRFLAPTPNTNAPTDLAPASTDAGVKAARTERDTLARTP